MEEASFYTFCDPIYFETPNRVQISRKYQDLIESLVPTGWLVRRMEIWLNVSTPEVILMEQGFKIHVSAAVEEAEEVLRRVVPVCLQEHVVFKAVADPTLLRFLNSKRFSRGGSGKFITIYPPGNEVFLRLLKKLADVTTGLRGPYILSDKQSCEKSIVFYRYGGFQRRFLLQIDGTKLPTISRPDGTPFHDERFPYYVIPDWVEEPLPSVDFDSSDSQNWLNGRYEVEEAMAFSNTGGIYKAIDHNTGKSVVLKEARPHTEAWLLKGRSVDATVVLHNEYNNLLALKGLSVVPQAVELFKEWENTFLVTEFFEGVSLAEVRAKDGFFVIALIETPARLQGYCNFWRGLAIDLIDSVRQIHGRGVIIGDVSPANILVNEQSGAIAWIDFESGISQNIGDGLKEDARHWFFPGFRNGGSAGSIDTKDDYYALGMVLYNLICPIQVLFELDKERNKLAFLDFFVDHGLPSEFRSVIAALLKGEGDLARSIAETWTPMVEVAWRPQLVTAGLLPAVESEVPEVDHLEGIIGEAESDELRASIEQLACDMLATMQKTRNDRLWPADPILFQTNPLSVAYGACGTALFLKRATGNLSPEIKTWLAKQPITLENYPPGLYSGLAGVAWSFLELDMPDRAVETLHLLKGSPLLFNSPDIFNGVAGWGMTALRFYQDTGDKAFLDMALLAGEHLVSTAESQDAGVYWRHREGDSVRLGYAHGASGIGLFLLYLSVFTGEKAYQHCAENAIRFDLSHAKAEGESLVWGVGVEDPGHRPYWLRGGAGVTTALIRFHRILGGNQYLEAARKGARGCMAFFSVAPHLFEGLASMGDCLLDMYLETREVGYLREAYFKARQANLFRLGTQNGIAFPGRFLMRISHDYGVGGAGIGLFFIRILNLAPRSFDLEIADRI